MNKRFISVWMVNLPMYLYSYGFTIAINKNAPLSEYFEELVSLVKIHMYVKLLVNPLPLLTVNRMSP